MSYCDYLIEVDNEITRATQKHKPMNSAHEGYAVIKEELEELWDEIKKQNPSKTLMHKEALHVAAMALRFIQDVCEEVEG